MLIRDFKKYILCDRYENIIKQLYLHSFLTKNIYRQMKELIEKINAEFDAFSKEAEQQSEKGNKAAGTRARKSALELTKLFKEFRKVSVEESKK